MLRFCLFLGFLLTLPATTESFGKYPSELTDLGAWTGYFAYVGVLAGVPLILGAILLVIMCVGCCCSFIFWAPYGEMKHKICVILYFFEYAVLLIATVVAFIFVIISAVFSDEITSSALDIADTVVNLPTSLDDILDIYPRIEGQILDVVIDPIGDTLSPAVHDLLLLVNSTIQAMDDSPPYFDSMNTHFTNIQDLAATVETESGPPFGVVGPYNFSTYEFPDANSVIPAEAYAIADDVYAELSDGQNDLSEAEDVITSAFDTVGGSINDTLYGVVNGLRETVGFVNTYVPFLTADVMGSVRTYISVFTIGGAVVFGLVYALLGVIVGFAPCCLFRKTARCGHCLRCLSCLTCAGVVFHTILAAGAIAGFFVVSDVCRNFESTLENARSIPEVTVEVGLPAGPINIVNATMKILTCGSESDGVHTYLDALGFDLMELFGAENMTFDEMFEQFAGDMDVFNMSVIDDTVMDIVANFTALVSDAVPDDYQDRLDGLTGLIDEEIATGWPQFAAFYGLNLTNETDLYARLNSLIDTHCPPGPIYDVDRTNIRTFDTLVMPWSAGAWAVPADEDEAMLELKPQLVELLDIFELPVIQLLNDNLTLITAENALLNHSVYTAAEYIQSLNDLGPLVEARLTHLLNLVDQYLANLSVAAADAMDVINDEIAATPLLQCNAIGDLFTALEDQGCGVGVPSFGVVGFLSCLITLMFFALFWSLMYTGMLLIDYERNGGEGGVGGRKSRPYDTKGNPDEEMDDYSDDPDYHSSSGGHSDGGPADYPREQSSGSNGSGDDFSFDGDY